MRFCYADPPYVGQAKKHYGCDEIDHKDLIDQLMTYDSWALSLSTPSLGEILSICPEGARVAAWVKPFHVFKKNVAPSYGWEPVIFYGQRKWDGTSRPIPRDFVVSNILLKKGFIGGKPDAFCFWLFELLGMTPDDDFTDLFHGSGAVTAAWDKWKSEFPEIQFRNLQAGPRKRFEAGLKAKEAKL
jgi:hypothetical protein